MANAWCSTCGVRIRGASMPSVAYDRLQAECQCSVVADGSWHVSQSAEPPRTLKTRGSGASLEF